MFETVHVQKFSLGLAICAQRKFAEISCVTVCCFSFVNSRDLPFHPDKCLLRQNGSCQDEDIERPHVLLLRCIILGLPWISTKQESMGRNSDNSHASNGWETKLLLLSSRLIQGSQEEKGR